MMLVAAAEALVVVTREARRNLNAAVQMDNVVRIVCDPEILKLGFSDLMAKVRAVGVISTAVGFLAQKPLHTKTKKSIITLRTNDFDHKPCLKTEVQDATCRLYIEFAIQISHNKELRGLEVVDLISESITWKSFGKARTSFFDRSK